MQYDYQRDREASAQANQAIEGTAASADSVIDRVQQVAEQQAEHINQLTQHAMQQADTATTAAGERLSAAAVALRERAPSDGPLGDVAERAVEQLDLAGTYLQVQDVPAMRADIEYLVRQRPLVAVLVGIGAGYLVARIVKG